MLQTWAQDMKSFGDKIEELHLPQPWVEEGSKAYRFTGTLAEVLGYDPHDRLSGDGASSRDGTIRGDDSPDARDQDVSGRRERDRGAVVSKGIGW